MKAFFTTFLVSFLYFSIPLHAGDNEAIYLSDTNDLNAGDGVSVLYRVDINEATNSATVTMLPNGLVSYDSVDGIAVEPDGSVIWMLDSGGSPPRKLAGYDVATATVFEVGELSIGDTDNAAMSPAGVLYATTEAPGKLYTIDTDQATVTLVGPLPEAGNGGDLAFASDGRLYMINNYGLFELTLPGVIPGVVGAAKIGTEGFKDHTGLVVRDSGDLLSSKHTEDVLQALSTADASLLKEYSLVDFDHRFGDMASGPSVACTRTIGYWKNHDWNDAVVTINGEVIDEAIGRGNSDEDKRPMSGYLWKANGRTYSMLYAQLIAAKLNTGDVSAVSEIEQAEALLLGKAVDAEVWQSEKATYSDLVRGLTTFNERYPCDEDSAPKLPPGC